MITEVRWNIPDALTEAVAAGQYDDTQVFRSNAEQDGYVLVGTLKTLDTDGAPQAQYQDPGGQRYNFYLVKFFDTASKKLYPSFELAFHVLTPRERRLVDYVRGWVPDVITPDIPDPAMGTALQLSLNAFNVQSPETNYTIDGFPSNYEHFLILGMEINILMLKQIKLGIRDFSYSDMGFQLTLDRDAKMKSALDQLKDMYWSHLALAKFNFAHMGLGLGTVPLPISFGGQLSRNMLNMLDIFSAMGRIFVFGIGLQYAVAQFFGMLNVTA
jgi:hypothetical protein